MNLEDSLKKLKNIQPDPTYTDYSRRAVLASAQPERLTVRNVFSHVFEAAGSLALVGLLIFAISGGFSGSKYLSPIQFSGIDPAALHAEAQAIDMQINLANLTYTEAAPSTINAIIAASTTAVAPQAAANGTAAAASSTNMVAATSTIPASTPSSSIPVNEALQRLIE